MFFIALSERKSVRPFCRISGAHVCVALSPSDFRVMVMVAVDVARKRDNCCNFSAIIAGILY